MTLIDDAAAWLDVAAVRSQRLRGTPDRRIDGMGPDEQMARLHELCAIYDAEQLLGYPGGFLTSGPPIAPAVREVRSRFGRARDLCWPSDYRHWHPEMGDYGAARLNGTVHARLLPAGDRPGPVVVAIHGYGAGQLPFEQLLWPIRSWHRHGIDVVLPTLPFHGRRAELRRRRVPPFPGPDPRFTNEGFRQAVHDLSALIGWLRASGHGPIGLAGMSLGGYTAALLATLLDELASVVLIIPLASLADFARAQGRLGEGPVSDALHAGLEAVFRPSSPLSRPPRVTSEQVYIAAARADQITGVPHAERLGLHFGVEPRIGPGGHLLQVGLDWPEIVQFTVQALRG